MSKNMANQGIQSINMRSTIMMAAKFEREFMQAALYISREAKDSLMNLGPINSVADLFNFKMTREEVMNVLFCIGFTK